MLVALVRPGPIPTGLRPHSQAMLGPGVPDMGGRGVAVNDDRRARSSRTACGTVEDIAERKAAGYKILRSTWRRLRVKGRTSPGQRPSSTAFAQALLVSTSALSSS